MIERHILFNFQYLLLNIQTREIETHVPRQLLMSAIFNNFLKLIHLKVNILFYFNTALQVD